MALIRLIEEHEASPEVKALYEEFKQYFGLDYVPELVKAAANNPETLKLMLQTAKNSEATWGREMVHVIGLATATAMSSPYAIDFHGAVLRQLGYDDAKLLALLQEISGHINGDAFMIGLMVKPDVMQGVMRKGMAA